MAARPALREVAWPAAVRLERSVLDGLEADPVKPKRPTAAQRRQLDAWGLDPAKRGVFCFNAYGFNRLAYKDPQSAPCPIKAAVAPCLVAKAPGCSGAGRAGRADGDPAGTGGRCGVCREGLY